jgi:superfamily II DNA/RNA helicase
VYGGMPMEPQIKALRTGVEILVATPGRLLDLVGQKVANLGQVEILVLDEADRMLDLGFKPTVDRIVAMTPRKRQTLFLSATLEGAAGKQAREHTRDNPHRKLENPMEPSPHTRGSSRQGVDIVVHDGLNLLL